MSETTEHVEGCEAASDDTPTSPWRSAWSWLTLAVSLTLLAVLLLQFEDWSLLGRVDPLWLAPAILVSLLLNVLAAPVKFTIVAAWFGLRVRLGEVWRLWIGLQPIANFLPFDSGTLLFAAGLSRQPGIRFRQSLVVAVYDKGISLVGICALVALGQLFVPRDHALCSPWLALGTGGAVLLYLLDGWWLGLLVRLGLLKPDATLTGRPERPGVRLLVLLMAMVIQSSDLVCVYLAARSLGWALDPGAVLGVYPVVRLLTLVPVTVNGFGAREALTVVFLGSWLEFDGATASSLLVDLVEYLVPALFGLFFLRSAIAMLGGSWSRWRTGGRGRGEPGQRSEPSGSC